MKLRLKYTGFFVSVFLIIAFVLLLSLLALITIDEKIFVAKYQYKTQFANAEGLSTSTPIYFKGFNFKFVIISHDLHQIQRFGLKMLWLDYHSLVNTNL